MKHAILLLRKVSSVFILIFLMSSCYDDADEHYKAPSWSKGSAWKTLEDMGNYSIFLEGAELADFKRVLEGKGLSTVMAPNDEAFKNYFESKGISSISSLPKDKLVELIGLHILYYSYNKESLINFRPLEGDGATAEDLKYGAGLYYKFRTRSYLPTTTDYDKELLQDVDVYHMDAMLPVYSHRMFETNQIDAKSNYEYFYPNSEWMGENGFNVANAAVTEYEIATDNGYIYKIDQVIEPTKTIYEELKAREGFDRYFTMLNDYSYYSYDAQLTSDFGSGTDLYIHRFKYFPDIALEWATSDYRNISINSYSTINAFAPSNIAFDNFFQNYWAGTGYENYEDISERNPYSILYLLQNTASVNQVLFPEDFKTDESSFSFASSFDFENIPQEKRIVCTNGILYGIDELLIPPMFSSVIGPAFKYPEYSYYVSALASTGLGTIMASTDIEYITLIPSNTQMEATGWILNENTNNLQELGDDGYANVPSSVLASLVNVNTSSGNFTDLLADGSMVIPTNEPWNYWFVLDGKITTSANYNILFNEPLKEVKYYNLEEIKDGESGSWSNGKAYRYYDENSSSEDMMMASDDSYSLRMYLAIAPDANRPHYKFSQLMNKAGLTNKTATTGSAAIPFATDRCIAFIPTNEAVESAIENGLIPGVTPSADVADGFAINPTAADSMMLRHYLKSYFVSVSTNGISSFPYKGSEVEGDYHSMMPTISSANGTTSTIVNISSKSEKITIKVSNADRTLVPFKGELVEVVANYNYFPFAFNDGCAHYINGVL